MVAAHYRVINDQHLMWELSNGVAQRDPSLENLSFGLRLGFISSVGYQQPRIGFDVGVLNRASRLVCRSLYLNTLRVLIC